MWVGEREPEWMQDAACRDPQIDTSIFFPERGENSLAAKQVCAGCPVQAQCLSYAIEHETTGHRFGVWGNTNPRERKRLTKGMKK